MQFSTFKFARLFLAMFALALVSYSCEKENLDVINEEVILEEEVGEFTPKMTLSISGTTTEIDAFASYCEASDGSVFLTVSNNVLLLDTLIASEEFAIDDFLIYYASDAGEGQETSLGGAVFSDTVDGNAITSVILGPGEVSIDEANSEFVTGSMTGTFTLGSGEVVDYSVEFSAEVVEESPWCD